MHSCVTEPHHHSSHRDEAQVTELTTHQLEKEVDGRSRDRDLYDRYLNNSGQVNEPLKSLVELIDDTSHRDGPSHQSTSNDSQLESLRCDPPILTA